MDTFVNGAHALASFPKAAQVVLKDREGNVVDPKDASRANGILVRRPSAAEELTQKRLFMLSKETVFACFVIA